MAGMIVDVTTHLGRFIRLTCILTPHQEDGKSRRLLEPRPQLAFFRRASVKIYSPGDVRWKWTQSYLVNNRPYLDARIQTLPSPITVGISQYNPIQLLSTNQSDCSI
jgi:hypothetical protein